MKDNLTKEREDSYRPFAPFSLIRFLARQYIVPREIPKGKTARFAREPVAKRIGFDARLNEVADMLVEARKTAKYSIAG